MSTHTPDISGDNRHLGDLAPRITGLGLVTGVVGLGLAVGIALVSGMEWERFLRAYLMAYCFALSLCLGGLFFVLVQHLARAGWSVTVRRIAEGFAANLQWMWILFIPVLVGMLATDLYAWTDPDSEAMQVGSKAIWFNKAFWIGRSVLYLAVWAALARYFTGRSKEQDETGDPQITLRMQAVAAPGMILYALTQSYAIIDWVMALEPMWFSTMFGVYFFAASCCGFGSALILVVLALQRSGRLTGAITTEHRHELGKFLFAFGIAFWAYIGFSQFMLIWYANIPEETTWYVVRMLGGWKTMSLVILLGHFLVPFVLLISRWPKRWGNVLAVGAMWMLFMHFIDIYWLVMPNAPEAAMRSAEDLTAFAMWFATDEAGAYRLNFSLVDLLCVAGVMGLAAAGWTRALRDHALVPQRDPRLGEALAFENY